MAKQATLEELTQRMENAEAALVPLIQANDASANNSTQTPVTEATPAPVAIATTDAPVMVDQSKTVKAPITVAEATSGAPTMVVNCNGAKVETNVNTAAVAPTVNETENSPIDASKVESDNPKATTKIETPAAPPMTAMEAILKEGPKSPAETALAAQAATKDISALAAAIAAGGSQPPAKELLANPPAATVVDSVAMQAGAQPTAAAR